MWQPYWEEEMRRIRQLVQDKGYIPMYNCGPEHILDVDNYRRSLLDHRAHIFAEEVDPHQRGPLGASDDHADVPLFEGSSRWVQGYSPDGRVFHFRIRFARGYPQGIQEVRRA